MPNDKVCKGTTRYGVPCQSKIVGDDGYCDSHSPERRHLMSRRGRMGGKMTAYEEKKRAGDTKAPSPGFDFDDLPKLKNYEDAKERLDLISRAVMSGRLDDKAANAAIRAVSEWVKTESESATAFVVKELTKEIERLKKQLGAA